MQLVCHKGKEGIIEESKIKENTMLKKLRFLTAGIVLSMAGEGHQLLKVATTVKEVGGERKRGREERATERKKKK